jgi:hypothetical protein
MKRLSLAAALVACLAAALVGPTFGTASMSSGSKTGPVAHAANTVPRVVHKRLDAAKARIRGAGLRPKAIGGGIFGIVVEHNWVVCGQSPRAGAHRARGSVVKLYVARSC